MIHAWENYPIDLFPPLWRWMEERIIVGDFTMPEPAYVECLDKLPECETWLGCCNLRRHALNNNILRSALAIKTSLGVTVSYHSDGVGENDVFIISTAKEVGFHLVSNEHLQPTLPVLLSRYKIPAVCNMQHVGVRCISFLDLLNELQPDLCGYEA